MAGVREEMGYSGLTYAIHGPWLDRVKHKVVGLVDFADILPIIYRSLIVEKYEESGRSPRSSPLST